MSGTSVAPMRLRRSHVGAGRWIVGRTDLVIKSRPDGGWMITIIREPDLNSESARWLQRHHLAGVTFRTLREARDALQAAIAIAEDPPPDATWQEQLRRRADGTYRSDDGLYTARRDDDGWWLIIGLHPRGKAPMRTQRRTLRMVGSAVAFHRDHGYW